MARRLPFAFGAMLLLVGAASAQDAKWLGDQLYSTRASERRDAARTLEKMGAAAAPATDALVYALSDFDADVREAAIRTLIAIGEPAAAAVVRKLEKSTNASVRNGAARILAKLKGRDVLREHVDALLAGILDLTGDAWNELAGLLASLGPDLFPKVLPYLEHDRPQVRRRAAELLARFSETMKSVAEHEDVLFKHLTDEDAEVCRNMGLVLRRASRDLVDRLFAKMRGSERYAGAAAVALAGIGGPAVPVLQAGLADERVRIRARSAHALGFAAGAAVPAVPALRKLLRDPAAEVRIAAARSLGRLRLDLEHVVPDLIRVLDDPDDEVVEAASAALTAFSIRAMPYLLEANSPEAYFAIRGMGPAALPGLVQALTNESVEIRRAALRCIVLLDPTPAINNLLRAQLARDDPLLRQLAATTLVRRDPNAGPTVRPILKGCLASDHTGARAGAARALGMLPDDDATRAALAKAMKDPDVEVRVAAAVATWRLGGEAAPSVRTLRAALTGEKLVEAARGLGRLGPAAATAIPDLIEARKSGSVKMQIAAIEALERFVRSRGIALGARAEALAKADKEVRNAIAKGLAWLAAHQDTKASGKNGGDGKWDSDDFAEHDSSPDTTQQLGFKDYDVGLTGLAVLAMMAAGNSEANGRYAANLTEGIDYLLRHQRIDGLIYAGGNTCYVVQHAIATHALAEACLLGSARCRRPLERAVHYIEWARNPYMAWRYEPRGGENDTHVTTWMVTALRFAEACGVSVEPAAFQGAFAWIDKMTDPNFGQTGYNYPGGVPERLRVSAGRFPPYKSQSMTAAGIWVRMMAGASLDEEIVGKSLDLLAEIPPKWEDGYTDLYYWHYGSLAMIHAPAKFTQRRDWDSGLREALLPRQLEDGAWRADGAWGPTAGRVWSTTMATLALLSPYRYPEGFLGLKKLRGPYKEAHAELRRATRSSDDAVERAAKRAVANLNVGR